MQRADFVGTVANFSSDKIDNDGLPYFQFALTRQTLPPPEPPGEKILYVDLTKTFAHQAIDIVVSAWASRAAIEVCLDHSIPQPDRVRFARVVHIKGIPPDPYPVGQKGAYYAGQTSFDRQVGGRHVRYAEIRGASGLDVVSVQIAVIPPAGFPSIPLKHVHFNEVNIGEPQITVAIQTVDASPIGDGYVCHFAFQSGLRLEIIDEFYFPGAPSFPT